MPQKNTDGRHPIRLRTIFAKLLVVVLCLTSGFGCNKYRKLNERNPHYQKAEAALVLGDYDSAEAYFLECLKFSPDSMKAHLQLGILYEEQKKDYPRAIAHYQAFLDSVGGQNEDVDRMLERVERLYLQDLLRKYVNRSTPTVRARPQQKVTESTPDKGPIIVTLPSQNTGRQRTYVVREGDNLSQISINVYGTSKHWERIFKANERMLKSPEKIKVGQTLIIPEVP